LPILDALKSLGNEDIKIAAAITDSTREFLLDALKDIDALPEQVTNLFTYIARQVEWAATAFPNPLLNPSAMETMPPMKLTVKTRTAADAKMLRSMLETSIDLGITTWRTAMVAAQSFNEDMPEVPQVLYEFSRGYLRTLLPAVEGDKLIFQQPELGGKFWEIYALMAAVSFPLQEMWWDFQVNIPSCTKNLKQITLAFHNYHDTYSALPPLCTVNDKGKPLHSWRVMILPFIEQADLYDKIRLNEPWDSDYNKQFHNVVIPTYTCPRNKKEGTKNCHYSVIAGASFLQAAVAGRDGEHTGINFAQIPDGLSNTLAVVEVKEGFCWMDPTADITLAELQKGINGEGRVGGKHTGGINAAFMNGAVHFIPNETSKEMLKAYATPSGGEPVTLPR
jgi:hypothetical protein